MTWPTRLPLIAILRGITPEETLDHVSALIESGFDAIEIPLNSPRWTLSLPAAVAAYGTQALIGAGTVLTPGAVDEVAALGGRLMVTPNTNSDVIRRARERDMYCAVGFATASEAFRAIAAGAQSLKLFPAANFGPSYVRALKAVLPGDVPLFAVGGITPSNLPDYLAAGCIGAGLGSDLYKPGQSAAQTRAHADAFIHAYRSYQP
jgi:2-dehydro-3-deoxyphosphogalactonate aldolase